ncbi:DUF2285 domain-containing protein [Bradyrhizobium sp. 191]|uniref:DNA -binding domain-containing protein n=1 Tax=Bradyrhizobium sp. 191 TaxID=2782659 RepID=UPI00320B4F13
MWRAIIGRAPGPPFYQLSAQRRERLALALCALDGLLDGARHRRSVVQPKTHPWTRLENP